MDTSMLNYKYIYDQIEKEKYYSVKQLLWLVDNSINLRYIVKKWYVKSEKRGKYWDTWPIIQMIRWEDFLSFLRTI